MKAERITDTFHVALPESEAPYATLEPEEKKRVDAVQQIAFALRDLITSGHGEPGFYTWLEWIAQSGEDDTEDGYSVATVRAYWDHIEIDLGFAEGEE